MYYLRINIYDNIIHKSQKVEKPKCLSLEEWINNSYPQNGTLLGNQK